MDLQQVEYRFHDADGDFDIEARLRGLRIASVQCLRDGDRLLLCDIKLEENLPPRWLILDRLLVAWLGMRKPWKLGRQGIGTMLLVRLLSEADAIGIREIKGSVMADAIGTQPWLLRWYANHGFIVAEPDQDCVRGAAKMVVRRR